MGIFKKFKRSTMKSYRKVFGHKSPYRRVYGSRNAGQAIGVTYRQGLKVANDLADLRRKVSGMDKRLNVEKKYVTGSVQTGFVAQTNFNAGGDFPGYYFTELTPSIPQGNGENERNGNSLKLTGFHSKFQFRQQPNCHSDRRLKMMLIKTTSDKTLPNILTEMYDINPLTGIIDYHSNVDYTNNKDSHKVILSKSFKVRQIQGGPGYSQNPDGKAIADCQMNLKLQELLRYELNTSVTPNDVRFYVVIFCDTGNLSTVGASANPGVMVPNPESGIELQFHHKWWYVDN